MGRHRPLTHWYLLRNCWPCLHCRSTCGYANTPTTQLNSQASSKHCFLSSAGLVPRGSQGFFYDSKHAAGVCLRNVHTQASLRLETTSQQLLLQVQLRNGTWEMSVQITRPPLDLYVLLLTTMSAHVGHTFPLIRGTDQRVQQP